MKRLFFMLSAVLTLSLCAAEQSLFGHIATDYEFVAQFDLDRILQLPMVKAELAETIKEWEKTTEFSPSDISSFVVVSSGGSETVMIKVKDGEKLRKYLDSSPVDSFGSVAAMQVNGRRIYRLNFTGKNESLICTFAGKDIVAVSEDAAGLERYFAVPKMAVAEAEKIFSGTQGAVFATCVRNFDDLKELGGEITYGKFAVYFSEKESEFIKLALITGCSEEKFAQTLSIMVPSYVSIAGAMLFSNNPEQADKLLRGLKSSVNGKELTLSLTMDKAMAESLMKTLVGFAEDFVQKQMPATAPAAGAVQGSGNN